ncbi:MAG: hypothetical protein Q9220_002629 [cf. Caloplaca sp. 1 TL-2023]
MASPAPPLPSTTTTTHPSTTTPSPTPPQTAEARSAFTASLLSAGTSHVSHDLQTRARDLHANAAAIDKQEALLLQSTKDLGREGDKLQKGVVDGAVRGVKETGDVQNWAEMLERDLCVLEDVMGMVEGEGDEAGRMLNGEMPPN